MSDERLGNLASLAFASVVASRAEPARYRRGRQYLREGAVTALEFEAGRISGVVAGSRRDPYLVDVRIPPARTGATGMAAIPTQHDLRFVCTCPDWDAPCKHAVAVALAFAERLRLEPEALKTITGEAAPADDDSHPSAAPHRPAATVSSPQRPVRHLAIVGDPDDEPRPEPPPEVVAFLRSPRATPHVPVRFDDDVVGPGSYVLGSVDLGAVMADALATLAEAFWRPNPD